MKAGIAIDFWKLSIFEAHLKRAGYAYTVGPGITAYTKLLTVDDMSGLEKVIRAANAAAAKTKGK